MWFHSAKLRSVVCLLGFALLLLGSTAQAAQGTMLWSAESEDFHWHIARGAPYLEDPTSSLSIEDLIHGDYQDQMQPIKGSSIHLGYSESAFWISVPIKNNYQNTLPIFISVDYALLDEVDFYWVQQQKVVQHRLFGDSRDLTQQIYDAPFYIDEFELPAGNKVTLWVRVKSASSLSVPLYVLSNHSLVDKLSDFERFDGAFFGLAAGLFLYNLFLLVVLRERIYFEYVVFVGFHIFFQLFLTGYAQFLFPGVPFLYERGVYFVGVFSGLCMYQFSRSYLRTAAETPKVDLLIKSYMVLAFVVLLLECMLSIRLTASLNVLTIFFGCVLLFVLGFVRLFNGYKPARYYLVGQGAVLASVMFTALSSKHVINGFEMAPYVMKLATIVELLFFSIGLADRINRFKHTEVRLHNEAAKANAESNARKLYIDQINEINQALESALKSRSEFLANMSHEIRTPMNGILGMLELIDDKKLDEIERTYIETARRSGKTLLELINEILDLSKIEADKLELESAPVSLQELLADLQHLYSHQLKEQGIAFNIEWDRRLPEGIMGDRTRLWQILTNLVSNGIKFTHQGAVTISMEKVAESSMEKVAQSSIKISVADTGIGIPEDKQAQIFDSFTQADGSTTRQYGGTGLGLTISRKLIEKMGGELKVSSTPGEGSTFYFTMPLVVAENFDPMSGSPCESCSTSECLQGIRVLVVEDNIVNQKVAQGMLKKIGVTDIEVCENGVDAIVAMERSKFDVVLMDVQMPVMDGYETTRKIREQEALAQRQPQLIIAMTAHSMEGDKKLCLDAGMSDYVAKPIQTDALKGVLLNNLNISPGKVSASGNSAKSA